MKKIFLALFSIALFVVLLLICGCKFEKEDDDIYCPQCDETLSWENTSEHSACYYGNVNKSDFDGDGHGWQLQSDCGWTVDPEEQGGEGHMLILYYPDDSMTFVWAWQDLFRICLNENWKGQTSEGVRMGCPLDQFLEIYPEMKYGLEYNSVIEYYMPDYEYLRVYGTDEALFYADFDSTDQRLIGLSLEDIY